MTRKFYLITSFIVLLIFSAQAQVDKNILESHFRSGNAPGQSEFYDLINSCYNYSIEKGLIYESGTNSLRAEVSLNLLKQMLTDTAKINRDRVNLLIQSLEQQNRDSETNLLNRIQTNSENLRFDIENLNLDILDSLYVHRLRLNEECSSLQSTLQDTARDIRLTMNNKLNGLAVKNDLTHESMELKISALENGLRDSTGVIRANLRFLELKLRQESESGDNEIGRQLVAAKDLLIMKIDSLAKAQNMDKIYQDDRMSIIETDHNTLNDTVIKMKVKLDTLNYTEHNFTQSLLLKLNNIEDGATRSDNNFADSLVTKLLAIEKNANNYQLPMSTHAKLGGIQLSGDFVLYNGKVFSALDPEKIDRWYATDTILNDWTNALQAGQKWTKVRMKIPTGDVDADGKKRYDYGEFNPPYKFIYDDLESSYYEYNGTDESNVILGEHEKQKKILGAKNTLLGHKAGYNLFEGGDENVVVGFQAGQSSANASNNVFVGSKAGQNIQGGADNIGQMNVAVGSHAMSGRNKNKESLALGYGSMELGEQKSSVAMGTKAMGKNSGDNNIAIGYEAALSAEGSNNIQNINLGYRSAYASMTAQRNIGIGDSTAFRNVSGKGNLYIGHGSGKTNTLSGNLFIGHNVDGGGSNKMLIGNNAKVLIAGDFTSGLVKIDKLSSTEIKIGENEDVINSSAQFVGVGGVNTPTVNATSSLSAAGIDIIKKDGALTMERYAQKSHTHNNADITTDGMHRFVTDTEKASWNNKVDKVRGKALSSNDFTLVLKNKLDRIAAEANKYVHPSRHSANMITTDVNRRFTTDAEKAKLAGIEAGANKYTHPSTHSANMITTNSTNRFVSDAEKIKLAGIEEGANKYTHPGSHSATMITTNANRQFVSEAEKNTWTAGSIPIGGIIMWSGTTIPNGWALCDGSTQNGKRTPDLRGRFIVGSYPGKSAYDIGKSGGTVENTVQTSENGDHSHSGKTNTYKLTQADIPQHNHYMGHTHKISAKKGVRYSTTHNDSNAGGSGKSHRRTMDNELDNNFSTGAASTSYTGNYGYSSASQNKHAHSIYADGEHSHTLPYYVLAFIMRVN